MRGLLRARRRSSFARRRLGRGGRHHCTSSTFSCCAGCCWLGGLLTTTFCKVCEIDAHIQSKNKHHAYLLADEAWQSQCSFFDQRSLCREAHRALSLRRLPERCVVDTKIRNRKILTNPKREALQCNKSIAFTRLLITCKISRLGNDLQKTITTIIPFSVTIVTLRRGPTSLKICWI